MPKLKAATGELGMAFSQCNDTVKALSPLQTSVVLLMDDVNRELDRLGGDPSQGSHQEQRLL